MKKQTTPSGRLCLLCSALLRLLADLQLCILVCIPSGDHGAFAPMLMTGGVEW